jgi:Outer membrane protein beta-barrel domain
MDMKKNIFFLLLTAAFAISVCAQNISIGARGGISIPNLSSNGSVNNPLNSGYSSRLGPDFAVLLKYNVKGVFSVEPMLEYSAQGGKKNGFQALTTPAELAPLFDPGPAPPYLYADYNSKAEINYLMLPLLARFDWPISKKSPFNFYVSAGPFVSLLLSAHQVTSGNSPLYLDADMQMPLPAPDQSFDNTTDIKNDLHKGNFGASANIGFSHTMNNSSVFVEAGGNYGFSNIQKGAANGKNQTGAATITLGYLFGLKNKTKSKN